MIDIRAILESLRQSGNFRTLPEDGAAGMLDFTSNDYLGLASRPELQREFMASAANRELPLTSSASRLLAAGQREYALLEADLEALYGRPALLFNSGYHANTGLISMLADRATLIVADRLVHASIIDGYKLSAAEMVRFRHNDLEHLDEILRQRAGDYKRVLIVVESVYSMDGDSPDMQRLVEIKRGCRNAMLYVDEAHAFGAVGPQGLGLSVAAGVASDVDILVGTLGKAAASVGAFAIMSAELRDFAVNRARSLIFSTALPPLNCAWSRFLIGKIAKMDSTREHLQHLSRLLTDELAAIPGAPSTPPSYICPLILGSSERAVVMSRLLAAEEVKVLPIRTPTVPKGTERLRISLSAAMTDADIFRLTNAIRRAYELLAD